MTCQTDDPARADAFKHFTTKIDPAIKPLQNTLNQKYIAATKSFPQQGDNYAVYNQKIETNLKLFCQENIELQVQESLLEQEYQTLIGAMTVNFQGEEQTVPAMAKHQLNNDRKTRQEAYLTTTQRQLQDKEKLEDIYTKLIKLRHQISLNAGFNNYIEYTFKAKHRFDYTPQHCYDFHQGIKETIIPLLKKIYDERKSDLNLKTLKPWDLACDPEQRPPLKPFETETQLIQGCSNVFHKIDPTLGKQFDQMNNLGLLDLMSRKGKGPGGYQCPLEEIRVPFIFMNSVGIDEDIRVLFHEGGHAFHSFAAQNQPLTDYRSAPIEYCEVASMAMELLALPHTTEFYTTDEAIQSKKSLFQGILKILAWIATIDAFQHWIYLNPNHTTQERTTAWLDIDNQYLGQFIDHTDLETQHNYQWQKQSHLFTSPMYYIEYGIAQLGALGVWLQSNNNKEKALKNYHQGLALGGSKPLPQLFKATGLPFDFSPKTIAPLAAQIAKEINL